MLFLGVLAGLALAFGYYTISPLFRTIEVNDTKPLFTIATSTDEKISTTSTPATKKEEPLGSDVPDGSTAIVPESIPTIRGPFPVFGTPLHKASGSVVLFEDGENVTLRYEDFETINGPDLFVYLATDKDAGAFVSLGEIRGTKGNINYEVPKGTDLSKYKYVLTWCKKFDVLFNSAEIK